MPRRFADLRKCSPIFTSYTKTQTCSNLITFTETLKRGSFFQTLHLNFMPWEDVNSHFLQLCKEEKKKKKKTVAVVFGSVCALRGGVCRGTEFVSLSGWGKKMLMKCSSPDFKMCCSGWVQHCQERRENKMWCRTRQHFQKWGAVSSGVCWWAVVLQWSKKHWNEIHVLCEVLSSAAAENGEAE